MVDASAEDRIPEVGEKAAARARPTRWRRPRATSPRSTRAPAAATTCTTSRSTEVVGKKPVALLFATPQLCQSRVCGPVVDIAAADEGEVRRPDGVHPPRGLREQRPQARACASRCGSFNLRDGAVAVRRQQAGTDHRPARGLVRRDAFEKAVKTGCESALRRPRCSPRSRSAAFPPRRRPTGSSQRSSLPIPRVAVRLGGRRRARRLVRRARRAVAAAAARARTLAAAAGGLGRVLGAARRARSLCGVDRRAVLAFVIVAGYDGPDTPLDNFAPTFIFITSGSGWCSRACCSATSSAPSTRGGRSGGVLFRGRAGPAPVPRVVRPLAGGDRAARSSPGSSSSRAGARSPATLATAGVGLQRADARPQGVYGVEPWSRYGEAFSVYFNLFSRLSVFETRDRVVGTRPLLGGLPRPGPGAGHGRDGDRDDRERHLRRPQPGPAVEGPRGPARSTASTRSASASTRRRRSSPRSAWRSACAIAGGFYRSASRARARSAATSTRGAPAARVRRTRSCRSRWSTSPRTT